VLTYNFLVITIRILALRDAFIQIQTNMQLDYLTTASRMYCA